MTRHRDRQAARAINRATSSQRSLQGSPDFIKVSVTGQRPDGKYFVKRDHWNGPIAVPVVPQNAEIPYPIVANLIFEDGDKQKGFVYWPFPPVENFVPGTGGSFVVELPYWSHQQGPINAQRLARTGSTPFGLLANAAADRDLDEGQWRWYNAYVSWARGSTLGIANLATELADSLNTPADFEASTSINLAGTINHLTHPEERVLAVVHSDSELAVYDFPAAADSITQRFSVTASAGATWECEPQVYDGKLWCVYRDSMATGATLRGYDLATGNPVALIPLPLLEYSFREVVDFELYPDRNSFYDIGNRSFLAGSKFVFTEYRGGVVVDLDTYTVLYDTQEYSTTGVASGVFHYPLMSTPEGIVCFFEEWDSRTIEVFNFGINYTSGNSSFGYGTTAGFTLGSEDIFNWSFGISILDPATGAEIKRYEDESAGDTGGPAYREAVLDQAQGGAYTVLAGGDYAEDLAPWCTGDWYEGPPQDPTAVGQVQKWLADNTPANTIPVAVIWDPAGGHQGPQDVDSVLYPGGEYPNTLTFDGGSLAVGGVGNMCDRWDALFFNSINPTAEPDWDPPEYVDYQGTKRIASQYTAGNPPTQFRTYERKLEGGTFRAVYENEPNVSQVVRSPSSFDWVRMAYEDGKLFLPPATSRWDLAGFFGHPGEREWCILDLRGNEITEIRRGEVYARDSVGQFGLSEFYVSQPVIENGRAYFATGKLFGSSTDPDGKDYLCSVDLSDAETPVDEVAEVTFDDVIEVKVFDGHLLCERSSIDGKIYFPGGGQ